MGVDHSDWEFAGTSRLNPSGSTGTGSATIPKSLAEQFYEDGKGVDMVVFTKDRKIMLVPAEEVNIEP